MKEKKDIFDHIAEQYPFRFFLPVYSKYKEILLYLFFGGLTTLVSIASFTWAIYGLNLGPAVANVISWVLAVVFAYITNRTWVFSQKAQGTRNICLEALSFAEGRLFTLGLEEIVIVVGITVLQFNSVLVKTVAQVFVLIGNYLISKFIVFRIKQEARK